MYTAVDDTIVAVSSAPGHALRGIVRLSGPEAVAVADRVFRLAGAGTLAEARPFAAHQGSIVIGEGARLPAMALLFRAPRSYTRQDLVELHTIGSPAVLEILVHDCRAAGARLAEPGEFTARAFLSGAMSLPAAEAVAATIAARSDAQLRAARRLMRGELAERVTAWREQVADLLALVVADIDFAEEPIDFITPAELGARLEAIRAELAAIRGQAEAGARLDVLPRILLLGPPNVGKSTLLNTLSSLDRAITSAVAGTTRDLLEAPVRLNRREAILLDAAGIDDEADEVIAMGRHRALEAASRVDLVAIVVDALAAWSAEAVRALAAESSAPKVVVLNKCDAASPAGVAAQVQRLADMRWGPVLAVSALTGEGLAELRALLAERLSHGPASEGEQLMLSARQRGALQDADAALARAAELAARSAATIDSAELLAVELQEALDAFAALTGAVTTEDLLGRIFANFCIGK
jgi:tRNA modification GTPase